MHDLTVLTIWPQSSPSSSQPILPGQYKWNQPSLPSRIPSIVWCTSHTRSVAMLRNTSFILLQ